MKDKWERRRHHGGLFHRAGSSQTADDRARRRLGYCVTIGSVDEKCFSVLCFRDDWLIAVEPLNRAVNHIVARRLVAVFWIAFFTSRGTPEKLPPLLQLKADSD
jgi:hypothetical protein